MPNPTLDAFVSTINLEKFGIAKTRTIVMAVFKASKACWDSKIHVKAFFFSNLVSGVAIFPYPLTNFQ